MTRSQTSARGLPRGEQGRGARMSGAEGGSLSVAGRDVRVTNLDKVLYPATGTTKADVLQYYLAVAPLILPELRDRPVTRKRWPDGVEQKPFIEKNLPRGTPDWVPRMTQHHTGQRSGHEARDLDYPLVDDEAVLVWLAQSGALELHAPQWRVDRAAGEPLAPDRLVVDLDPGAPAGLDACAEPPRRRDRLQPGNTHAHHENARRLNRPRRRHHHRQYPVESLRRQHDGRVTREIRLRAHGVHLLCERRPRDHLHAD